ncbi:translation initiation factor IF-2 subunit beta [Candidatus Bathyarchaeota archaeon]|nr:translation initiation factor IF-2 subunit beta [Candidatus Bathyarchaeota archaeon]
MDKVKYLLSPQYFPEEPMASSSYEEMLRRALTLLPKKPVKSERFMIPSADTVIVGNRTIIRNFKTIASTLNRKPEHLLRFLCKEAGSAGSLRDDMAEIHGKFSRSQVNRFIRRYVQSYVICPVCKRPDTHLEKHERILYIVCDACGARSPVITR